MEILEPFELHHTRLGDFTAINSLFISNDKNNHFFASLNCLKYLRTEYFEVLSSAEVSRYLWMRVYYESSGYAF